MRNAYFDPETPLTVKDWQAMRELVKAEADRLYNAGNPESTVAFYDELADKCQARADALQAGRVMP